MFYRAGMTVVAAAVMASAAAADVMLQDFESEPTGANYVHVVDEGFGFFTGGMVAEPGVTVDAGFLLGGSKVYYGTDIFYTNRYADDYHCCGYGRHEMLITAPGGVEVIFYGHGPGWLDEWVEVEVHREIVTGHNVHFGWGDPIVFLPFAGTSGADITSIHWLGVNGADFAIDNFTGVGIAVIPEPASWAMMIAGFGLVGGALRQRKAAIRT